MILADLLADTGFGLFVQYYLVDWIKKSPDYFCNFQQSGPN